MELTITDFDDQYFRYLASTTIAKIASSKINVGTPLGALALTLHIALLIKRGARSGVGGGNGDNELRCTGVPPLEDGNGGFAPPVRELPPGVLVPNSWEESAISKKMIDGKEVAQTIAFRYWRGGGGGSQGGGMLGGGAPTTVYLALQLLPSTSTEGMEEVQITFGPRREVQSAKQPQQPPLPHLTVKLGMHVNLDGFKTAKKSSTAIISPTLFYISLSELLSQFDATFGGVLSPIAVKTTETNAQLLEVSQPIPPPTASMADINNGVRVPIHPTMPSDPPLDSTHVGDGASKSRKRGDFEGDLLPGGPLQPPFGIEDNNSAIPPGSQVGPDHPIFDRTFGDDDYYDYNDEYQYGPGMGGRDGFGLPGLPSGMGMRPR